MLGPALQTEAGQKEQGSKTATPSNAVPRPPTRGESGAQGLGNQGKEATKCTQGARSLSTFPLFTKLQRTEALSTQVGAVSV